MTRGLQNLVFSDLMMQGGLAVQDEAAGLVVALLDPQPGERVLDACAAPGGKAIASALRMSGGALLAADVNPKRLELVRRSANTAGVSERITTFATDLREASCAECDSVVALLVLAHSLVNGAEAVMLADCRRAIGGLESCGWSQRIRCAGVCGCHEALRKL